MAQKSYPGICGASCKVPCTILRHQMAARGAAPSSGIPLPADMPPTSPLPRGGPDFETWRAQQEQAPAAPPGPPGPPAAVLVAGKAPAAAPPAQRGPRQRSAAVTRAEAAQARARSLRANVERRAELLAEGLEARDWETLEFESPAAWYFAVCDPGHASPEVRRRLVAALDAEGYSVRGMAAELDISKSTVQRDLEADSGSEVPVSHNGTGTQSDEQTANGKPSAESAGTLTAAGGSLDGGGQEKSSETTESDETPAPEPVTSVTPDPAEKAAAEKKRAEDAERQRKHRAEQKEKKQAACDHDWRICGCGARLEEADRAGAFVLAALAAVGALSEVPAEVRAAVRELAQKAGIEKEE
jgi:hypothetical protein